MKYILLILMSCVSVVVTAQSIDSTKVKAPKANTLSKYQQPSQYGIQPAPAPNQIQSGQPNPDLVKKIEEKRVNSSYQYENGRITGGKTSLKLGKKKD
ncbi:hypothetical protein [Spirosoma migulaei]